LNRRCVFLDRDGVINEKPAPHQHIRSWSEFRFLPNIADWVRIFNTLGYLVIVVTNQRGMARETVEEIHGSVSCYSGARGSTMFSYARTKRTLATAGNRNQAWLCKLKKNGAWTWQNP
jgi:HAD superfamily hydrolase (TIGR01662 family)